MAEQYDFTIDTLKFRCAINEKTPYTRSTAPFRKDQFDAAPTPGDQSLTGWWTRGQLSFHKGAGVKFYEVLDGETILNRFQDSDAADVWTAGQVSLIPNLADLSVAATSATPGTLGEASGLFYTTTGGMKFHDGTTVTGIATSDGVAPTSVVSDGRYYLAVNGDKIERQSVAGGQRTNHVTNPGFETNTTGWAIYIGGSLARDVTTFYSGSASLKFTRAAGYGAAQYTITGLTIGTTYKITARVFAQAGSSRTDIQVTDNPANLGTITQVGTTGAWTLVTMYRTAVATSEIFYLEDTGGTGNVWLDSVMVTEYPFDGDYFDGSTPGGAWVGTANASKSTYATNSATASFALWRHGDGGHRFVDAWWAKGRIWTVDNTGRWYTLSPAGGTVAESDAIWASSKTAGQWSLADTPGAVFLAESGTIYSVTVDVSGSLVNLAAPVVAATLPAGENISSLFHYLGYLIITTNKGVRVAAVQNANIVYGPLVITGDFSTSDRIGAGGNLVYLVGQPTGHSANTVCVLDLTQEVSDLRPAWAPWLAVNNTPATAVGALVDPGNRLFVWAGNLYGSGAPLAASGFLTTGYHRFGTLDPKSFRSVSVRCGGTGGQITVSRVDADGTVSALGTITPGEAQKDFPLGLTAPAERIALKFTLARSGTDSTKGPQLLGYQIKALPVPERQRILKVPLMIQDHVRLKGGVDTGRKGRAWSDLRALEALESAQAIVSFTDHRTSETGSAYIDSLDFQGETPATAQSNGFGGTAYATLRVVS